jgi:cobalt/nickel transport system permease protein
MPYGLSITLPAMVLSHAFVFSVVEALITALAFGYIARNDPTIIFDYDEKAEKREGVGAAAAA